MKACFFFNLCFFRKKLSTLDIHWIDPADQTTKNRRQVQMVFMSGITHKLPERIKNQFWIFFWIWGFCKKIVLQNRGEFSILFKSRIIYKLREKGKKSVLIFFFEFEDLNEKAILDIHWMDFGRTTDNSEKLRMIFMLGITRYGKMGEKSVFFEIENSGNK